jgi:hypothetical protein
MVRPGTTPGGLRNDHQRTQGRGEGFYRPNVDSRFCLDANSASEVLFGSDRFFAIDWCRPFREGALALWAMKSENRSQGVALGYLIVVPLALEDRFFGAAFTT